MKILLRKYRDKYYIWKDATWNNKFFVEDGDEIEQINILAVKDDDRKDAVKCVHCGAIIKNDPESIEKHFAEQEANRDCLHCSDMRAERKNVLDTQFAKNEDGTYMITEISAAILVCKRNWWDSPSINSPVAEDICKYNQCRRHGVEPIQDIFTQYPDLFNKQVAVDVLNNKNSSYNGYSNGYFVYDLKCHDAVKAHVNELGIIDHFSIKFRGNRMVAFYSAKYDKLFFKDWWEYCDTAPCDLSENRYNEAIAKISALYKEEKKK